MREQSGTNQNAAYELTEENIKAGNAHWEYIVNVLNTGNLHVQGNEAKEGEDVFNDNPAQADSESGSH